MALLKRKRAGLSDAMSVVTRFVNACNRHDADGIYSCLHPNFDSIQPMFPSRNFRGADQVRRNWQAIFDAEPGFRLTVLRSAVADDIVWLELHGAGRDAEVAGVFVMGIQGDRIRWARIYSALVEPLPPGTEDATAGMRDVPIDSSEGAGSANGEVVAPVVDIERSGRRRRRSRARREEAAPAEPPAPEGAVPAEPQPQPAPPAEPPPAPDPVAATGPAPPDTALVGEPPSQADAVEAVAEPAPEGAVAHPEPEAEPEVLVAPGMEPEPPPAAEVTGAHDMVSELATGEEKIVVVEPEPEPEPEPEREPEGTAHGAEPEGEGEGEGGDAPKWRFGKKTR